MTFSVWLLHTLRLGLKLLGLLWALWLYVILVLGLFVRWWLDVTLACGLDRLLCFVLRVSKGIYTICFVNAC